MDKDGICLPQKTDGKAVKTTGGGGGISTWAQMGRCSPWKVVILGKKNCLMYHMMRERFVIYRSIIEMKTK